MQLVFRDRRHGGACLQAAAPPAALPCQSTAQGQPCCALAAMPDLLSPDQATRLLTYHQRSAIGQQVRP